MRFTRRSVVEASRSTKPAFTNRSIIATMVAPSTANLSASSDCDSGERALAAMAMVIQLAWLTPRFFSLRSTAWRQDREVLCSASLNRSSKSLIRRSLMVRYLMNVSQACCKGKCGKIGGIAAFGRSLRRRCHGSAQGLEQGGRIGEAVGARLDEGDGGLLIGLLAQQ